MRDQDDVFDSLPFARRRRGGQFDPAQDLFVILLIQRSDLKNSDASEMRKEFQTLAVALVKK